MEHVVTAAVGVRERRLEDEGENDRERRKRMRRCCGRTTKIETGERAFYWKEHDESEGSERVSRKRRSGRSRKSVRVLFEGETYLI